jgi:hypothetical protein
LNIYPLFIKGSDVVTTADQALFTIPLSCL